MKKILFLFSIVVMLLSSIQAKSQISAMFQSATGVALPITNCGNIIIGLTNTSTGTYDSAKWEIYRVSAPNCIGGNTLVTSYTFSGPVLTNNASVPALSVASTTVSYYVCLTIKTSGGLSSQFCSCVATINPTPLACFTASDTVGCGSLSTTLSPCNPLSKAPYTFYWNVSGNDISNNPIPSQFPTFGTGVGTSANLFVNYPCSPLRQNIYMQVKDANGCMSSLIKTNYINAVCKPVASMFTTGNLCAPGNVTLNGMPTGMTNYTWWIPAASATPAGTYVTNTTTHNFSTLGCTNVKLKVYKAVNSTFGCSDSITQNNAVCIQAIAPNPTLSVSTTNTGSGQFFNITFTACTTPLSSSPIQGNLIAVPCNGVYPGGCVNPVSLGSITSFGCSPGTLTCVIYLPACFQSPVTYCLGFRGDTITNLTNGCVGLYSFLTGGGGAPLTITINPCPSAAITLDAGTLSSYCSPTHQFCFNGPTPNVVPNLAGATYQWYTSNPTSGGAIMGTGSNFCTTFSGYGFHDVWLKVTQSAANGGCAVISSATVSLKPLTGSFTYSKTNGCDSVAVDFMASPATDSLFTWDFGDGTVISETDTFIQHTFYSNVDTCYTIKLIHRNHTIGGSFCIDTIIQYRAIHIGHKIHPIVTVSEDSICLKGGKACIEIYPDSSLHVVKPKGAYISLCNTRSCNWYFTRPHKTQILLKSTLCDSPKVCFTDTGVYSAHYVINNNGCADTVTVDSLIKVRGIKSSFKDSVWCNSNYVLTSNTVTLIPSVKSYGFINNSPTTIQFILFGQGKATDPDSFPPVLTYWPLSSPNVPKSPPRFTYTFAAPGIYTVWMIVSSAGNPCWNGNDTVKRDITIQNLIAVIDPSATTPKQPYEKCLDAATFFFSGLGTSNFNGKNFPASVKWSFGDGKDTSMLFLANDNIDGGLLKGVTHQYDSCGYYQVKLIVSNLSGSCKDSASVPIVVTDMYRDTALYGIKHYDNDLVEIKAVTASCNLCSQFINHAKVCPGTLSKTIIDYKDGSPPAYHNYDTILGNWTSFVHCFLRQPVGSVQYWMYDNYTTGCAKSAYISTPPYCGNTAKFTGLPDTVLCLGTGLNLVNKSTGVITTNTWTWDAVGCNSGHALDSQSTSTKANFVIPPVTANGYYYLRLHVINNCLSNGGTPCQDDTCIRVHFQNPIPFFDMPDTFPCPSSFLPIYNLTTGAYDSLHIEEQIPGIGQPFQFNYSKSNGGIPDTIFLPTGAVGDVVIRCRVISKIGGCDSTFSKIVTVLGPKGKQLPPFKQHACVGDSIYFNDSTNSSNGILAIWCDGIDIIPHNASEFYHFGHAFSCVGKYPVYFFITDGSNCSYPIIDTVFIDGPDAAFTRTPSLNNYCGTANIIFKNTSIPSSVSPIDTSVTEWTITESNSNVIVGVYNTDSLYISLTTPGTYSVKMKTKSMFGCDDSIEQISLFTVHPKPTASFTTNIDSICISQCVNFTNTSTDPEPNLSYHWYFDWPNKVLNSTANSPNYCYFLSGAFNVALIDSSTTGCVDTSFLKLIDVSADVVAKFTTPSVVYCGDSATVQFTNLSSSYAGINYCWNFGDGVSGCQSSLKNPIYKFYLPASSASKCYIISLTVTNRSGCDSTITDTICLYPKPLSDFDVNPPGKCNPITVTFIDKSITTGLSPISNYDINWGQGPNYNSSNFPTGITHQYLHPGITSVYVDTIIYIITTQQGCRDTAMNIVSSYPIPTACVANDTLVCAGQQVNLGCAALPNQTYNWFEPTGTNYSPDRYNSNPFIKPQIDTTYRIEVKNQYGCKDTAEIHVSIIPFIVPAAGRDTAICIGGSALLFAQGGNTYSWVNKKTQDLLTTASALIVSPPFPDEFIYTATINGTCNSDLIDVHVTVFPLPSVVLNKDINDVIAGHEVRIPQVGAAGGFYTYLWNPNYNIDSITSGSPTVWPEVTTTYQVLLTDIHGCSDTSEVTVHVLCNASNAVYIPNAFIPGTGVNGTFYVQGKGVKQLNYLRIYDRWGSLVYSVESSPINNPTSGWDGNFNGSPMPSGVFMYQMEVQCAEGEVFPLTGTMTLIR